jgi:16S rRNA (cytidine1402-2'-O)-methyltransferase
MRALNTLQQVDLIAAEDTRKTGRFLSHHQIKNDLISYHEHNESRRTPQLISKILDGASIALVSNAGTPSVSDPGYRLIAAAIENNIKVIPIPGVSAATTAMSVSGLSTDSFVFIGFPPKKKGKRQKFLAALALGARPLILYASPKGLITLLEEILASLGDRPAVLAREMTKLHEEFIRGSVSEISMIMKKRAKVRGECTLIIAGREEIEAPDPEIIEGEIKAALVKQQSALSEITKLIARKYGLPKNNIYEIALKVKDQISEDRD